MTCLTIDVRELAFIKRLRNHEPATPSEPASPSEAATPSEPASPSEAATPSEPGVGENVVRRVGSMDVAHKMIALPVGDFLIEGDSGLAFIIERKTIKDLCASITDGRFRDQKARMLESVKDPNKIVYIIEGSKQKTHLCGLTQVVIDGAIQNLIFKHNFKVIQTENEEDTFNNVMLLFKKVMNKQLELQTPIVASKLLYKKDKIYEDMLAAQLSVIPGVSYNMAKVISKAYASMASLVEAYNITGNTKLLSDLPLTSKRKLGEAVSIKVYNAIHKCNAN
jgi:ERCC4-type nuclease